MVGRSVDMSAGKAPAIKRGDLVIRKKLHPTRIMTVVSDPGPFNGALTVTCQWAKTKTGRGIEQALFTVEALEQVEDEGLGGSASGKERR